MQATYGRLSDPQSGLYPSGTTLEDVRELYFGTSDLDAKLQIFLAAARRVQQAPAPLLVQTNPDLQTLLVFSEGSLLADLDAVVTINGLHVQARLRQLNVVALASLLITLLTLLVVGTGVLLPLLRRQDRVTAALENERNFARQLMDNMGQGLGVTGPDHRYRYVNAAYARMIGRSPEEMIGHTSNEFMAPEEQQNISRARSERRQGQTSRVTHTFVRPDGSRVQALAVVVPNSTDEGVGGIAVLTDLTERIRVEEQLRRRDRMYHTLAANFPDGALGLFDHDLRYTLADGTGLSALQLKPSMMEGRTPSELFPAWLAEQLEDDYRAALQGVACTREIEVGKRTYLMRTLPLQTDVSGQPGAGPAQEPGPVVFGGMAIVQDISQRRQAERDLVRAGEYTAALLEVSRLAQSDLSPEEVALNVARVVGRAADLDWGGLAVLEGDYARTVTAWHQPTGQLDAEFIAQMEAGTPRGRGMVWQIFEQGEPVYVEDYPSQSNAVPLFVELGVQSLAFLPLTRVGPFQYLMSAIRRHKAAAWTEEDRALFQAAARTMQLSLERRHYVQELERAALIDMLTGLGNRRAFEHDLARELERTRRTKDPVGVLMIDLDGLKQLNDREGHERGDALLVTFAATLSTSLRAEDRVYRLGGDEYAAILVRASSAGQETLMQRVRRAVTKTRLAGFPEVDASAGLSFTEGEDTPGSALLKLADERMYLEKQEHRRLRKLVQP
jgi:diguanylate cyclase (GGDEF)-like protein/PAS domain S-box-containing protein